MRLAIIVAAAFAALPRPAAAATAEDKIRDLSAVILSNGDDFLKCTRGLYGVEYRVKEGFLGVGLSAYCRYEARIEYDDASKRYTEVGSLAYPGTREVTLFHQQDLGGQFIVQRFDGRKRLLYKPMISKDSLAWKDVQDAMVSNTDIEEAVALAKATFAQNQRAAAEKRRHEELERHSRAIERDLVHLSRRLGQ